jgi:hypothetical protein
MYFRFSVYTHSHKMADAGQLRITLYKHLGLFCISSFVAIFFILSFSPPRTVT